MPQRVTEPAVWDTSDFPQELTHRHCQAMDTPVSKAFMWRLYGQPVFWCCAMEKGAARHAG